jgi:hypothetical protein
VSENNGRSVFVEMLRGKRVFLEPAEHLLRKQYLTVNEDLRTGSLKP